jgi:hypothetical protein
VNTVDYLRRSEKKRKETTSERKRLKKIDLLNLYTNTHNSLYLYSHMQSLIVPLLLGLHQHSERDSKNQVFLPFIVYFIHHGCNEVVFCLWIRERERELRNDLT